jgi:hypothetical protein
VEPTPVGASGGGAGSPPRCGQGIAAAIGRRRPVSWLKTVVALKMTTVVRASMNNNTRIKRNTPRRTGAAKGK